jgi:Holliday junction resolvase
MADTPEKRVKRAVEVMLKNMDVYYFFPPANGYGRSGIPDIICCVNGRFLAIECKAGGNKPTPLQIREIGIIRRAGGVAIVANETNHGLLREVVRELKGAE